MDFRQAQDSADRSEFLKILIHSKTHLKGKINPPFLIGPYQERILTYVSVTTAKILCAVPEKLI